jgi:hypothetical protein
MGSQFPAMNNDMQLRHGYRMIDLHKMTVSAVIEARWRIRSFDECYDVARFAIVEHMYEADDRPHWHDLVHIGKRAICRYLDDEFSVHGQDLKNMNSQISRVRFRMFWWDQSEPTGSCENHVVDTLAMRQIWPKLTYRNKRLIKALAVHGDYDSAARSLGISRNTFIDKLSEARKQFLRLWHEGERPSRIWGRDHKGIDEYTPSQSITTITRQRGKRKRKASRENL